MSRPENRFSLFRDMLSPSGRIEVAGPAGEVELENRVRGRIDGLNVTAAEEIDEAGVGIGNDAVSGLQTRKQSLRCAWGELDQAERFRRDRA